jgi:hypothetical protein
MIYAFYFLLQVLFETFFAPTNITDYARDEGRYGCKSSPVVSVVVVRLLRGMCRQISVKLSNIRRH